jgi:mitochondrial fission protein ELM1
VPAAHIWVLKGLRAGDSAQALDLASRLDGTCHTHQLAFNALHVIPNWLGGATVRHLTPASRAALQPPWPNLVVATGKRTAAVAMWIKYQSRGKTRIVQLGRPQTELSAFDLVVTTPQYGMPQAPNVIEIPLPFGAAKPAAHANVEHHQAAWAHLPRPWTMAVIGAAKFPLILGQTQLADYGRLLSQNCDGSILLFDSPRSAQGALSRVAENVGARGFCPPRHAQHNAYAAALTLSDRCIVTSDSMSMISDMVATGKPTAVYRLPISPFAIQWSAQRGAAAGLAKRGVLMPPRNVTAVVDTLIAQGHLGDLHADTWPHHSMNVAAAHAQVVGRVNGLLRP